MSIGRILIAATGSGAGKTMITCGILDALRHRGLDVRAFKCGPDYIDPMFHRKVIGIPSYNLDLFFTGKEGTRDLLAKHTAGCDVAVIEGVMGYYDGWELSSDAGSAAALARATDTPTILVVPASGAGRSLLATIRGFLRFRLRSQIRGIILNRVSAGFYPRIKEQIEEELGIPVVGYLPALDDCALASRHLGLHQPSEIRDLKKKMARIRGAVEECVDLDAVLDIAEGCGELSLSDEGEGQQSHMSAGEPILPGRNLRIGVARDAAFTFFYEENLEMLRALGARPVFFSPIKDKALPKDLDGLLLVGGYPELHAKELSENTAMRKAIRDAIQKGLPTIAECGGFLYLHEKLTDLAGKTWPMAGVIKAKAFPTKKLQRFGYAVLDDGAAFGRLVKDVHVHEFHTYESEDPGRAMLATKANGEKSWRCFHSTDTLLAGFPHLYFPAAKGIVEAFLETCGEYRAKRKSVSSAKSKSAGGVRRKSAGGARRKSAGSKKSKA